MLDFNKFRIGVDFYWKILPRITNARKISRLRRAKMTNKFIVLCILILQTKLFEHTLELYRPAAGAEKFQVFPPGEKWKKKTLPQPPEAEKSIFKGDILKPKIEFKVIKKRKTTPWEKTKKKAWYYPTKLLKFDILNHFAIFGCYHSFCILP